MTGTLEELEERLRRTLTHLEKFREDSRAVDFPTLEHLFNTKPTGTNLWVTIREDAGYIYTATVCEVYSADGGSFNGLSYDGENVYGIRVGQILSVRIRSEK